MDFCVDSESTVVETLDEVAFPQWTMTIQQSAVESRRQLQQLTDPSGCGQRRTAQMVFEVEIAVEGPREVGDTAQEFSGMLPEGRVDILADNKFLVNIADVIRSGALGRFEYLQPGDMHGVLA